METLRCYQDKYNDIITDHELGVKSKTGCKDRLQQLLALGKIQSVDYDGLCEALLYEHERGNEYTLYALSMLLHVEVRLVVSHPVVKGDPPHITCRTFDPSKTFGLPPRCIVYIAQEKRRDGTDYFNSLEDDPSKSMDDDGGGDDAASVYTAGSTHTDWQVDEKIAGEEHTLSSLLAGIPYGDDRNMIMIDRTSITHATIYLHDTQSGANEHIKDIKLTRTQGPPKRKETAEPAPRELVPIDKDDAQKWTQRLCTSGSAVTSSLAQTMLDALNAYIDHLGLTPGQESGDEFYFDRLGTKMHALVDTTKQIKMQMYAAHSEAHAPFKIVVVGVEGAGKSTTVNQLTRNLAKDDANLAEANPTSQPTKTTFSRRYADEPLLDQSAIASAEEQLELQLEDPDSEFNSNYEQLNANSDNEQLKDILPTGTGCAITALPTTLKFDPEATAVTLRLTYRTKADVDDVLTKAKEIHEQMLGKADDDTSSADGEDGATGNVTLEDDADALFFAHQACAMLNIDTSSGNAITEIAKHDVAKIALPEHLKQMLGRTREIVITAPSAQEMFTELNKKLVLLTVGGWSNWGVLESVTCVIPSETERLTIVDVPGLGSDRANPFRMKIVHDTITNVECSSLLVCLKNDRGLEGVNGKIEDLLQEAGVYEVLSGEELERRIGKVFILSSLDWSRKAQLDKLEKQKKRLPEVTARQAGDTIETQAKDWLLATFVEALKAKGDPDARRTAEGLCGSYTRCFAADVCGRIEEMSGVNTFSLAGVIDELAKTARDSLRRQRQVCLQRLVLECVLPFYEEHAKLDDLHDWARNQHETIPIPNIRVILEEVYNKGELTLMDVSTEPAAAAGGRARRSGGSSASAGSGRFRGEAVTKLCNDLQRDVMQPRLVEFHDEHGKYFLERWDSDHGFSKGYFFDYRKDRGRQLGIDLKSDMPHETKLRDALMPDIAKHSVKPLQDKLRAYRDGIITRPIFAMAKTIEEVFQSRIKAPDDDEKAMAAIEQLHMMISSSLRAWRDQEVGRFNMVFARMLQELEMAQPYILHQVMTKQNLRRVATSVPGNKNRKNALAKKSKPCAEAVVAHLMDVVHRDILGKLQTQMYSSFTSATRGAHRQMVAALGKQGDMQELTRSQAFAISSYYARFTAGVIKGLHDSHLVDSQLKHYEKIEGILELGERPPIGMGFSNVSLADLLGHKDEATGGAMDVDNPGDGPSDTAGACAGSSGAGPSGVSALPAGAAFASPGRALVQATRVGWVCPNCGCPEHDTQMAYTAPLRIDNSPCIKNPGNCWCESVTLGVKYCRLCVRYFNSKHLPRSRATERRRLHHNLKRKQGETDAGPSNTSSNKAPRIVDI